MRVTIVPNSNSRRIAKPGAGRPSRARPVVQKAVFCLLGVLLGFLLSQYLIWIVRLRPGQDFQTVRLDVHLHKRPANIYPEDSSRDIKGDLVDLESPAGMSRLETSLLISAILNVIQNKIRHEIESEGFIIAEADRSEEQRRTTKPEDMLTAVEMTRVPVSGYTTDLWLLKVSPPRRTELNRIWIARHQDDASNSVPSGPVTDSTLDTDPEYYEDDTGNKFDFVEAGQEPTASSPV